MYMISALLTETGTISVISHKEQRTDATTEKIRSMKYLKACLRMINTLLRMHMRNSTSVTSVDEIPRYSAGVILRAELRKRGQKWL